MPKGFCALTNLRSLNGFQTHMDDGWCSLEELGPLYNLRNLGLVGLENVSTASFTTNARLGEKVHLTQMVFHCTSKLGSDGLVKDGISEKDKRLIEEVFDGLYPPRYIEAIRIQGYFGGKMPIWLRWLVSAPMFRVPRGLPSSNNHRQHSSSQAAAAFPRLHEMVLSGMVQWEEWEWEEEVQLMLALEELLIQGCKLRVSNFPMLQKLKVGYCPKLQSLKEMDALRRFVLNLLYSEKRLPLFQPDHLLLDCHLSVLDAMSEGKPGLEWDKFSHIQKVEGYTDSEDIEKRWHVFYTREPYSMETNIDLQSLKMYCDGYEDSSDEEWIRL